MKFKMPKWIINWYNRKFGEWHYLGHTRLSFTNTSKTITSENVIHFWAQDDEMKIRKITNLKSSFKEHTYYQEGIFPWLADKESNLYGVISTPSDWLQIKTKASCGWEWQNNKWVKPVKSNVINLVK